MTRLQFDVKRVVILTALSMILTTLGCSKKKSRGSAAPAGGDVAITDVDANSMLLGDGWCLPQVGANNTNQAVQRFIFDARGSYTVYVSNYNAAGKLTPPNQNTWGQWSWGPNQQTLSFGPQGPGVRSNGQLMGFFRNGEKVYMKLRVGNTEQKYYACDSLGNYLNATVFIKVRKTGRRARRGGLRGLRKNLLLTSLPEGTVIQFVSPFDVVLDRLVKRGPGRRGRMSAFIQRGLHVSPGDGLIPEDDFNARTLNPLYDSCIMNVEGRRLMDERDRGAKRYRIGKNQVFQVRVRNGRGRVILSLQNERKKLIRSISCRSNMRVRDFVRDVMGGKVEVLRYR